MARVWEEGEGGFEMGILNKNAGIPHKIRHDFFSTGFTDNESAMDQIASWSLFGKNTQRSTKPHGNDRPRQVQ